MTWRIKAYKNCRSSNQQVGRDSFNRYCFFEDFVSEHTQYTSVHIKFTHKFAEDDLKGAKVFEK